jgi:hypothetical protein
MNNNTTLFSEETLRSHLESLTSGIRSTINQFSEKNISDPDFDLTIGQLVSRNVLNVPILQEDDTSMKYEEVVVDVMPSYEYPGPSRKVKKMKYTFFTPFKGSSELFLYRTSEFNFNPPEGKIENGELIYNYLKSPEENIQNVKQAHSNFLFSVKWYLERVVREVGPHNNSVGNVINSAVSFRKTEIERQKKMGDELGFKIRS